jgi:4,5:9,10-diseco-3-hydroxy-5,9,17-trioxoandrosta-1(10),2-diene-4-oate hydrolase
LHAIGHGARDFERFRERMRDRFRVLTLDWPGHGHSTDDSEGGPSVSRYAEILEGFLDGIGIERVTLIGNSIGGGAAIRFAAEFPGRVRAMVLENPAGLDPPDLVAQAAISAMVRFFEAGAAGAPWFGAAYEAYYRAVLPGRPAREQRARIVAWGRESAPLLARAWASFADPEESLVARAASISRPTLFAWAERDRFVQLRRSQPAILQFNDARLLRFDAGHSPHLETPDDFENAFMNFMGETQSMENKSSLI